MSVHSLDIRDEDPESVDERAGRCRIMQTARKRLLPLVQGIASPAQPYTAHELVMSFRVSRIQTGEVSSRNPANAPRLNDNSISPSTETVLIPQIEEP